MSINVASSRRTSSATATDITGTDSVTICHAPVTRTGITGTDTRPAVNPDMVILTATGVITATAIRSAIERAVTIRAAAATETLTNLADSADIKTESIRV